MNTKLITEYYQSIQTGGCSYPISSSFKQLTIQEYFKNYHRLVILEYWKLIILTERGNEKQTIINDCQ